MTGTRCTMLTRGALLLGALASTPAAAEKIPGAPGQVVTGALPRSRQAPIDPRADQALRRMSDYLGSLPSFQVRVAAVDEAVLTSGQKLQFMSDSIVLVRRPDRLRSERVGAKEMAFFDDGRTLTLYCKGDNVYSSVPAAPGGIDAATDQARRFGLDAPGADLLSPRPYAVLTEDVVRGDYIGLEIVDGKPCHHLAFQGNETDWQIWIQDGPQPLPLRYSILSKNVTGQPEFAVRLSRWQTNVNLPDELFTFQPPAGATRVAQFPAPCGGSMQQQFQPSQQR